MSAQVEGVDGEAGLAEPLGDVVVAPGVLGVPVAQHDHTARVRVVGLPYVVDDVVHDSPGDDFSPEALNGDAA